MNHKVCLLLSPCHFLSGLSIVCCLLHEEECISSYANRWNPRNCDSHEHSRTKLERNKKKNGFEWTVWRARAYHIALSKSRNGVLWKLKRTNQNAKLCTNQWRLCHTVCCIFFCRCERMVRRATAHLCFDIDCKLAIFFFFHSSLLCSHAHLYSMWCLSYYALSDTCAHQIKLHIHTVYRFKYRYLYFIILHPIVHDVFPLQNPFASVSENNRE